ncbi:Glycosyl-phosphatidyl inositol-anchored, plant [Corchorus olitorius]|uniref:Glycosyl-phosphatidyl inositol-anchored, plant n=1 Tax=Corchorus olitorius TaxID=93759 RepID=A0A1R3KBP3_9ROSI|nr:Glycosyl-phosphatidyl inositol-anchored, plant [Corchorus olitorius]
MPLMKLIYLVFLFIPLRIQLCHGQAQYDDYDDPAKAAPPPGQDNCNGVFMSYAFTSRNRELPHVKNVTAQSWAFKSIATIINSGTEEVKGWKMFVGFHHREILVAVSNAVVVDGGDLPLAVGNGTIVAGYPMTDLKTSIDTAGDYNQIAVQVEFTGTMFGLQEKAIPMPKTISLANEGWKCPKVTKYTTYMHTCCKKDPKYKGKPRGKYLPKQYGDLNIMYDVMKSYEGSYEAQVTMDNNNPLGRLDHWNVTWEWMRGEFIYSMRGAYTHKIDYSDCLYGIAGQFLKDFDFTQVMNCQKRPVITDLPATRANDSNIGKIPYCCRNGTLLPPLMDESKARSIFQLRVYKLPPDTSKTVLYPPQRWNITGVLNPHYKCGAPMRVDPTEFPEPTGLQATTYAIASWQIVCNITKPEKKKTKCCVSFSAYYNDSAIPCSTCACGCDDVDTDKCNPNGRTMLLPADALLVPFENRTAKAKAFAHLKHRPVPKRMPCPDNCGVSINWHINSDYKTGWTARITLFNWGETQFEDWFTAVEMKKAYPGYENVYSFNGTKLNSVKNKNTLFFQGLPGLNYLMGEVNGTKKNDPRVPGKQQSVVSFTKKQTPGINIRHGDGFPTKVFFNGEECALPDDFPRSAGHISQASITAVISIAILTFLLMQTDRFH